MATEAAGRLGDSVAPATISLPRWLNLRLGIDLAALAALTAWAWRIEGRHFWGHNWIAIGWGDWAAHAYRASFFERWGLTNWDPTWDNGLPLFQGYQTLPHVLTVAVAHLTGMGIPNSMMIWTALLLMLLPLSGYLCLRGLGLGAAGALLGAALLLDNADIGPPIEDFSFLFGLALMPIMVWIILKTLGTRKGYLGAVAVGITPYLHPYATTAAAVVFIGRLAFERRDFLNRRVLLQGLIMLLVSAFYWLPYVTSARPKYEDPWNSSMLFEHQMMAVAGFRGLSLAIIVLGVVTLAVHLVRPLPHRRLVFIAGGSALGLAGLAFGSYGGIFPAAVVQIHFARLMPVVGVMAAIAVAPLGDSLWSSARRLRPAIPGMALGAATVGVLLALVLAEGRFWFHQSAVPVADTYSGGRDLVQWSNEHNDLPRPMVIWTTADEVASGSYAAFGQYHFTGDYIVTRQWTVGADLVGEAMASYTSGSLIQPNSPATTGDFAPVERLLRLYGVRYVFLSDYIPANREFVSGKLKGHLKLVEKLPDGWMAEVPWAPVSSFVAPLESVRATTVPNVRYLTEAEQRLRDQKFGQYVDVAYAAASTPAVISWQSPTNLTVHATAQPGGALVIPQNWDTVWTATVNGRSLPVERVGPNFLAVQLGSLSGPITVDVVHHPYSTWIASGILIALGVLLATGATVLGLSRRSAPAAPSNQE